MNGCPTCGFQQQRPRPLLDMNKPCPDKYHSFWKAEHDNFMTIQRWAAIPLYLFFGIWAVFFTPDDTGGAWIAGGVFVIAIYEMIDRKSWRSWLVTLALAIALWLYVIT